ncbi:hypothetical protein ACXJJ3_37445 [Kribbella sp. WER1]
MDDGGCSRSVAVRVERRRVRVWFGDHVVADYRAEAELAERYAEAMSRRFAGLRVTCEPLAEHERGPERKLPGERLWEVAPK